MLTALMFTRHGYQGRRFSDVDDIAYDDADSIRRKAEYARKHSLSGAMTWKLSEGDQSLLQAVNDGLNRPHP